VSEPEMFGALLHKRWEADPSNESAIIGYWAEDYSEYRITAPPQLRDKLVAMQNWMSDKYCAIEDMKRNLTHAMRFFK